MLNSPSNPAGRGPGRGADPQPGGAGPAPRPVDHLRRMLRGVHLRRPPRQPGPLRQRCPRRGEGVYVPDASEDVRADGAADRRAGLPARAGAEDEQRDGVDCFLRRVPVPVRRPGCPDGPAGLRQRRPCPLPGQPGLGLGGAGIQGHPVPRPRRAPSTCGRTFHTSAAAMSGPGSGRSWPIPGCPSPPGRPSAPSAKAGSGSRCAPPRQTSWKAWAASPREADPPSRNCRPKLMHHRLKKQLPKSGTEPLVQVPAVP